MSLDCELNSTPTLNLSKENTDHFNYKRFLAHNSELYSIMIIK